MTKYLIDGLEIHSNYKPRKHNFLVASLVILGIMILAHQIIMAYLSALINTY